MSKKILSCVLLAAILCTSMVSHVYSKDLFPYDSLIFGESDEEQQEVVETVEEFDYEMEIKTVVGLGWMPQLEIEKYNPKDLVTQYDVYEALINMLQGADSDKNINVANDNVTVEQLADIFINNLSLSANTDEQMSFFETGTMLGLFKGMKDLSKDSYVNREQLAKVIYNSFELTQYKIKSNYAGLLYEESGTVLENIEIEILEGIVTANEYINFYSDHPLREGFVAIDKLEVKDSANAKALIGKRVTAYIKDIDEDPVLMFAYEEESKKADTKFETDDYITSNSSLLTYYDGQKIKRVNLNSNARVLYNGRYIGQISGVDISAYTSNAGYIQTVDTTNDDKADIILITVYETWFVESAYIAEDDFIITNSLNDEFMEYDKNATYYFIKNGEAVDADSITANMVLYVSESLGTENKLYMVYISDKKLEGTVTALKDRGLTLDSTEVEFNKNFTQNIELKPAILYLGYDGKLAHIEYKKSGDMQYGYIMSLGCDDETNDNGILIMQVYTIDGKAEKYMSVEKLVFQNGQSVISQGETIDVPEQRKTAKEVYDILMAQGKHQVVQFALNSDGKITKIATAVDSSSTGYIYENAFSKDFAGSNVRFYNLYMGARFKRTGKMKYIQVPTATDRKGDEKYYSVKDVSGDATVSNEVEFYDSTVNGCMENGFIVIYSDDSASTVKGSCEAGVVTGVNLVYDEIEGGVKYQISIISRDGGVVKADVSEENAPLINAKLKEEYKDLSATDLKQGDIILYETSDLGELKVFSVEVRASEANNAYFESVASGDSSNQTTNFSSLMRTFCEVVGTEVADSGDIIFSANTQDDKNPLWNRCYCVTKSKKVLIYDTDTKEITVGTGKDILKGDKIYIQTNYAYIRQTYIIVR